MNKSNRHKVYQLMTHNSATCAYVCPQKSPTYSAKEPHISCKRAPHKVYQLMTHGSATCAYVCPQKSPSYLRTSPHNRRKALYIRNRAYTSTNTDGSMCSCVCTNVTRECVSRASRHIFERVMLHIWTSHVTRLSESCRTNERVMTHTCASHVAYMNESCHLYERIVSPMRASHVAYMNKSCHLYERVMLHIWMSHVTYMRE